MMIPEKAKVTIRQYAFVWILVVGMVISGIAFSPSFNQIFRSDQWFIANLAFRSPLNLSTVLRSLHFEMFGEPRFQPLAYFLLLIVNKVFKASFLLHHIFAYLIHLINGLLIYILLRRFLKDKILASISAVFFIVMFSHADTIIWTHFIYISLQGALFLASLILFFNFLEKRKHYLIFLSLFLLMLGSLLYEAALLMNLILIPLFFWKMLRDSCGESEKYFMAFSISLFVFFLSFLLVFMYIYFPKGQLLLKFSLRLLLGIKVSLLMIINNLTQIFSMPAEYFFEDIPYIVLKKLGFFSYLLFFLFIIYFFVCLYRYLYKREKEALIACFLYLAGFSYIFTIAFSRAKLYVATQPRYMYFLDAILIVILAFAIKDIFLLLQHRKRILAVLRGAGFVFFSFLLAVNICQIYKFSNDINLILSPMQKGFYDIRNFLRSNNYDGRSKIFIEEVPHPKNWHLFLGRGIYLETLFYNKDIFTRHIRGAKYIYSPTKGISLNPLYGRTDIDDKDFTLEFDLELLHKDSEIRILDNKNNLLRIVGGGGEPFVVFGGRWKTGDNILNLSFKIPFVYKFPTHIVIQRELDTLYAFQDGELIFKKNMGNAILEFKDKDLFLGTVPYFPPQGCYFENFSVWVGKNKYRLSFTDKYLSDKRFKVPVPYLDSNLSYYIKSFKYLGYYSFLKNFYPREFSY